MKSKLYALLLGGLLIVILTMSIVNPVLAGGDQWHGENGQGYVYRWESRWVPDQYYIIPLSPMADPYFYHCF
jgi:hypothetical protein